MRELTRIDVQDTDDVGGGGVETFAEQFARTQGQPIIVDGRPAVGMLKLPLMSGQRMRLIWRHAIAEPPQGVVMKVAKGAIVVAGGPENDFVLWRDTSPPEVRLEYAGSQKTELRLWNCWRDDRGVMNAWLGNAAMRVSRPREDRVIVECNSRTEVTFRDVVFDLVFDGGIVPPQF